MKKTLKNITIFATIFATMLGMFGNARALSLATPVQQVVVYQKQSATYDNFNAAIFAQGQLGDTPKLPSGSEVSLYVDVNKVNGAVGLQTGTRCSAAQASADYYQNTITMEKRFCTDFNDAILDNKAVYGIIPTEAVFLHKANGERCNAADNGGAVYLTNPASTFFRNYLVKRGAEKLIQFNLNTLFMDNLQAGWNGITSRCGGAPKEYSNSSDYLTQMAGLAQYVNDNLPAYKVEGNLANATTEWDKFSFLDGAMCENCFTNWGGSWPSSSRMLSDLSIMNKWVKGGHKVYVISQAPDTSAASNRFTFAASLLVANGSKVYFHFGADYGQFYSIPEYKYNLGLPIADYTCNGNICTRTFEHGVVTVDFAKLEGSILLVESPTPAVTLSTPIPTLIPPTVMTPLTATVVVTSTPTSVTPIASPVPTQPLAMPGTNSVDVRVSSGKNDVEENSSGGIYVNSSDLELIYDTSAQTVGIRFTGVKIPNGAVVTKAYIQFKVDQTSSQAIQLSINGEASANASAFTTSARNVSKRARTSSSVIWSPPAWSKIGETGVAQQTPNLKAIVQEVVTQPNWKSGNALAIIITGKSGQRVAKSYEGDVAGAPLLHVEFSLPVNPTVVVSPTATLTAIATATVMTPTAIPATFTLVPPSPTIVATATEVVIPTDTPAPTLVPPSPTTEVVDPTPTP